MSVLNYNQERLDTSVVEFGIRSLDCVTHKKASAYTTKRVTGNMQVIEWNLYKTKWRHLKDINSLPVGPCPIADVLIGVHHPDLLYTLKDVRGHPGEPIARLTPLGWTCIGALDHEAARTQNSFTFFVNDSDKLNCLIRRFWDMDEPKGVQLVKPEEKLASDTVLKTIAFEDDRFSVGLPWKTERHELPDNFKMALRRLQNTEKRLQRYPELSVLQSYQNKGYIRTVPAEEEKPPQVWYLPF